MSDPTGYKFQLLNSDGTYAQNYVGNIVYGAGYNNYGSLTGNSNINNYSSPVQVGALNTWKQIYYSTWSTVGIKVDGTLWTWGYNIYGQLGNGNTIDYSSPIQVGSLTNWKQISINGAGDIFWTAIKTDGTLWACGYNYWGQLGNNSSGFTLKYSSPIQVGSLTNWSQISCGRENVSSIKTDGTLWAWGRNIYGQLGNNAGTNHSSPIQIGLLTDWSKISNGWYHSQSIKTDGTLWTWGYNISGQLGNETTISYSSPIQVGLSTNWSKISCGYRYSAAIKTDGTLWTWGENDKGQLGNGTTIDYSSPIQVGSLNTWKNVACGYKHTVAVKTDGTSWTWGYNESGQLGNGTVNVYYSPIQVGSLTVWSDVTAGYSQTGFLDEVTVTNAVDMDDMFVRKDQFLTAGLWGFGASTTGQLGTGTLTNYNDPTQTGLLTNWKQISCGYRCTLAVKTDGTLWGYGSTRGDIGNGVYIFNSAYESPVQVGLLTNWKLVSYSGNALAIKTDGTLWSWGNNDYGQLGNGTTINYSSPIQIGSLTNWKQVSVGYSNSAAVKTDGTIWVWGRNDSGQLGNGTIIPYSSPIQIGALTNWKQVSSGYYCSTAIKNDGTLWAWGSNSYGELGNGTTINYSSPIQIGSLTNWKQISVGQDKATGVANHMLGIKTDGTLWSCGYNKYGQLGNGTTINYSSPIQIGALTTWKQVSCGYHYVAAIKTDGTLWTWGKDYQGNLGRGSAAQGIHYSSPCQVGSLTSWKYISASNYYADSVTHTQGILAPDYYWNQ